MNEINEISEQIKERVKGQIRTKDLSWLEMRIKDQVSDEVYNQVGFQLWWKINFHTTEKVYAHVRANME
jgi:hypothetical protein